MAYWVRAGFKDDEVFAEATAGGELLVRGGKVRIAYREGAKKTYSTFKSRLSISDSKLYQWGDQGKTTSAARGGGKSNSSLLGGTAADLVDLGHLHLWSDGACSGNPGPAGAGTVLLDGEARTEWSTWLGQGTNNIAELVAVQQGLEALTSPVERTVVIHTDSQYVIGVLAKSWKAKANPELIGAIRRQIGDLPRVVWHWVRGHEGVELNERCDALARLAIANRRSSVD